MVTVVRVAIVDDQRTALSEGPAPNVAPQALRLKRARWANPRLIAGALVMLAAAALGGQLASSADDTVPVLVATDNIGAGQELTAELVETRRLQLGGATQHYLADVGTGHVVTRDVAAGELVPSSAVRPADALARANDVRYVSVALPRAELPTGLRVGSAVDVWVVSANGADNAHRLAADVKVGSVSGSSGGALGVEGSSSTVTLAVGATARKGPSLTEQVSKLVAAARDGRVYLARVPGSDG